MGKNYGVIKMTKFSMPDLYYGEDTVEFKLRMFNKQRGFKPEVAEEEIMRRRARLQRIREHGY